MKYIQGDLINLALLGRFDVVVHGCNCFHTMGAGIARTVRAVWPEAYEADCQTIKGDQSKLGTCSEATVENNVGGQLTIVNAYTQFGYSTAIPPFDYEAFEHCMKQVVNKYHDKRIGLPQIGAGLAGGDWAQIVAIIERIAENKDVTVVIYQNSELS